MDVVMYGIARKGWLGDFWSHDYNESRTVRRVNVRASQMEVCFSPRLLDERWD